MTIRTRRLQAERMDASGLDPAEHRRALAGLGRINAWSGTVGAVWPAIRGWARRRGGRVRVLDLACGGGEVACGLWLRARREGMDVEVAGCDRSALAVEASRGRARGMGAGASFFAHDVIADGVPDAYDVVLSTLFLHHLDEGDAVDFLGRMAGSGAGLLMIDDLSRGALGWGLAWVGSRVLSRSAVVHFDALRSVEGAFTAGEARGLAERAGWRDVAIRRHWPARYLMTGVGR
jgi:SAM-dependent methyltransferase